jgi:lipopolysaccharide transport system permease protein
MRYDLLFFNVKTRLKSEVSQTYLSYLWWVLEPVLLMAVFYFVFEVLLKRGGPGFVYVLLVGVTVWTWFSSSVSQSANSIFRASNLMAQVNVNKLLFPLTVIFQVLVKQFFIYTLMFAVLAFAMGVNWWWSALVILIVAQFLLTAAISILGAALVPFVPDLRILISLALRLMMFCSGVFYTADMIAPEYRQYFLLNPVANLIEQYRVILIQGASPDWLALLVITIGSASLLLIALLVVHRFDKVYPRLALQ